MARHPGQLPSTRSRAACKAERYDLAALGEAAAPRRQHRDPAGRRARPTRSPRPTPKRRATCTGAPAAQDLIDSALMLELRAGIDALINDLNRAIDGFTAIAGRHRRTAAVARTSLQHALPMPFGLKLAGYAAALARSRERLRRLRKEALVLQFGGAAGTLAALGENGLAVTERLAALLDLPAPDAPWHAHSDRLAEIAVGARDPHRHLRQDRPRRRAADADRSRRSARAGAHPVTASPSTMPHKRSPTTAARRASPPRPSRRTCSRPSSPARCRSTSAALGGWQAQWHAIPALLLVTSGALAAIVDMAQGLEIDAERMRSNLDVAQGLIMARGGHDGARRQARAPPGEADRRGSEQAGARRASATSTASWPRIRA